MPSTLIYISTNHDEFHSPLLILALVVTMFPLLFFLVANVQSSPIDTQLQNTATNHTALWNTTIGWSDVPSYRGTANILWSCLVTIFASIYTVIHLDIPLHRLSKWIRLRLRLRWAACCLCCPELILYTAIFQYLEARKLYKKLKEIDTNSSRSEAAPIQQDQTEYNMSYAFWVTMGGFVVNTKNMHGDYDRVSLTASGVAFLAQHGYRIVSKDQIADHSKANGIAKFLICIQISWMLLQVFVRLIVDYPITLLEVYTSIQAACALMICLLFWNKPFDVEAPLVLDASGFEDILAYMMMTSLPIEEVTWPDYIAKDRTCLLKRLSTLQSNADNNGQKSRVRLPMPSDHYYNIDHAELSILILDTKSILSDGQVHKQDLNLSDRTIHIIPPIGLTQEVPMTQDREKDASHIRPLTTSCAELETSQKVCPPSFLQVNHCFILDSNFTFEPSSVIVRRWKLCAKALRKLVLTDSTIQERYIRGITLFKDRTEAYVGGSRTSKSIIFQGFQNNYRSTLGPYLMSFLNIIHACILLTLWNFHFPSYTEALLWRISALKLGATFILVELAGPVLYFLECIFPIIRRISGLTIDSSANNGHRRSFLYSYKNFVLSGSHAHRHKNWIPKGLTDVANCPESEIDSGHPQLISYAWEFQSTWMRFWTILACFYAVSACLFIILGYIYTVVEIFASLRAVPAGTMSATPWVQAIPHI